MSESKLLRGMSTVSFWADDMKAAIKWYTELLGVEPYFVRPNADAPEYAEFRIGDYEHELGIVSTAYLPEGMPRRPAGVVLYWHVDDIKAALQKVQSMGATDYQPLVEREAGFVTASVIDPFGNILGLMYSPHYLEILEKTSL
jgi:predicted enzyme related to lactoylglutathione lyase